MQFNDTETPRRMNSKKYSTDNSFVSDEPTQQPSNIRSKSPAKGAYLEIDNITKEIGYANFEHK